MNTCDGFQILLECFRLFFILLYCKNKRNSTGTKKQSFAREKDHLTKRRQWNINIRCRTATLWIHFMHHLFSPLDKLWVWTMTSLSIFDAYSRLLYPLFPHNTHNPCSSTARSTPLYPPHWYVTCPGEYPLSVIWVTRLFVSKLYLSMYLVLALFRRDRKQWGHRISVCLSRR